MAFLLTGCAKGIYENCRPTGSFFNPFGSGCPEHNCLTKAGKEAVLTPSRKGICTLTCTERGRLGPDGGICNGKVYIPKP